MHDQYRNLNEKLLELNDINSLSTLEKDEIMESVKQQNAMTNIQELLTKMTEKCFKKCIFKPGVSLDNTEQRCVALCMDRYLDSWNLVSNVFQVRIRKEKELS